MEDLSSSRRSSSDEYTYCSTLEPTTVHDVMSLELSHHAEGGYLDPRSFGDGGSSYSDEYGGQMENRYEGYEQPPIQQRSHFQQGQPLPPPGSRFDHHATHPPMRSIVPTYPVKTIDPATYGQQRLASYRIKPPRVRNNGRGQKKEQLDPKTVEDEVARNVSQILSATKQQKLQQEANQRCGIPTPAPRINFSCSDCGKQMTSHRNLQRHRQTNCCPKVAEWVDRSTTPQQEWTEQTLWNESKDSRLSSEDSDSLSGGHGFQNSYSESSGWCSSPNRSYSPSNLGQMDMANMLPLSLDTDDSQTHSSSASHCSGSSNGKGPQEAFPCESCKKVVCSLRSLKRHYTTCKLYLAQYGPPEEIQPDCKEKKKPTRRAIKSSKFDASSPSSSQGSLSPELGDSTYEPPSSERKPKKAAADSTQEEEEDNRLPKPLLSMNTCADCNRQLCSASNLKRHRATCKAALSKTENGLPPLPPPPITYSANLPEIPVKERNIIDRSYAAAVAASEQVKMQAKAAQESAELVPPSEKPRQQYAAYIIASPRSNQKPQPWVTVGEHLRAKHVAQKMLEAKDEPPGAVLLQSGSTPDAPAHNQIVQIRRPSLLEKEDKVFQTPPAIIPQNPNHMETKMEKAIKQEQGEIPPLESIITTQPLAGDRVTGIPVLVHDSRQYSSSVGGAGKATAGGGEFVCPECRKTYSCRKNVKRHRMAVHKLSADDINRWPGPVACPHAVIEDPNHLSPLPRKERPPKVKKQKEQQQVYQESWQQSTPPADYIDKEDRHETARIAAELKRSAEIEMSEMIEEKKPRPELAEADTTFNEDREFGSGSHHSSPGAVSSSGPLPSLASWMSCRSLSVEIPYSGTRSAGHSPLFKRRFDDLPTSLLCQDDGMPLDPMLGHGPSSGSRSLDDDMWFKREEMPDSTTCQRLDRSTSPCVLMETDTPQLGCLPYTRKRAMSSGSSNSPPFSNDPKKASHLCNDCGKFYSSEWNLERHRRESCQSKTGCLSEEFSANPLPEDVSIVIGSCRFVLPRGALTKASSAFTALFQLHDPAKGELRLEGDPMDFQNLLDVYNDPINLTRSNVDSVLALAEQYKFPQVTDTCAKFIQEELSKMSLMHAIRLADQYKLLVVKQRLFSSISIEVFRALNSDRDYQMMSSELKAELLEKWGTFL